MSNWNKIVLKKYTDVALEFDAASAITPGMLLEIDSSGDVQPHSTADGQVALKLFAREDDLQGNTISDAYTAANRVMCNVARPGDEIYALIEDGETISIGDLLVSAGDGRLKKFTEDSSSPAVVETGRIVAVALEDIDLATDSSGETDGGRAKVIVG